MNYLFKLKDSEKKVYVIEANCLDEAVHFFIQQHIIINREVKQ